MMNGELLKSSRKKIGFSQQGLADYFGVENTLVCRWEKGGRPIPKEVLKMADTIRRTKKETAVVRFKRTNAKCRKKQEKTKLPQRNLTKSQLQTNYPLPSTNPIPNSTILQGGFCPESGGVDTFIQPKQEDSVFSPPKEGSMEELILESYIEFKKKHDRFPVDADFINSEFKEATKNEVLQCFGSLGEAKKLANKLKGYRITEQREEKIIRTFPSPLGKVKPPLGDKGFSCPCCGRRWRGINDFYNALRGVIKERLSHIEQNPGSYQIAVLKLMAFLFGTQEVNKLGYDVTELENSNICFCEGQFKPDWHSSFKAILTNRFLSLLQSTDSQSPEEAIKDCTVAVFGI